jgi:hypothetical protein
MPNLTKGEFDYLKNKIFDDKDFHEKEFLQRIDPDIIDAYFEGDPDSEYKQATPTVNRLTQNRLFPVTATLLTTFYPSNLKFICTPKAGGDELDAKISASAMNYYWKQMQAEQENQLAIMSAWMYGFGAVKQGWRTAFKKTEEVKVGGEKEGLFESIKKNTSRLLGRTPAVEEVETPEYIESEGPFLNFVNSKKLFLDKNEPFGRGKCVTEHIPKNLYDLRTQGLYPLSQDFISKFKRGGKDEKEINIDLYEHWYWLQGSLYLFVYVDGWHQPLRFEKVINQSEGFPYRFLGMNIQVNRTYPISHMKVAQRQQRFSDYIMTLQKEAIEKFKDITVWNGSAFDAKEKDAIRANKIGTNVFTDKGIPPSSVSATINSVGVPKELFAVNDKLDMNIKEILSVVGARQSGESEFETASQEKIADYGNQLRSLGLEEQIHKFLINQARKLHQDLKQFATMPVLLEVSGLNIKDPQTQMMITQKAIQFQPGELRNRIPAELDIDIDVSESMRRDLPVIRKQMMEYVTQVIMPLMPAIVQQGKTFDAVKFVTDMGKNFETLSNPEQYFVDLPSQPMMPPVGPGMPPGGPNLPPGIPEEGAIQEGAQSVGGPVV